MFNMKILELFCGTKSVSNIFLKNEHEVFTIDIDERFKPTWCVDILNLKAKDILEKFGKPDVIWASPDCKTYSVAGISRHRKKSKQGSLIPVSDYAKYCDLVNTNAINLIKELNPKYYFIENPRAGLRKMEFMKDIPRYTVTYCQYGDTRMKPTDIWTNHHNPRFKKPCKNGSSCHVPAPRGSRTGTQGLKNQIEKAKIPKQLAEHIYNISKK